MKRLQYFNLAGVCILAALCVVQWQENRRLNLRAQALERAVHQARISAEQEQQRIKGLTADLEHFRAQLQSATGEGAKTSQQLALAERDLKQLQRERDQLQTSVTNWAKAVAERDELLKTSKGTITELNRELNARISKFNELAQRHNQLVKDWNEQQARLAEKARPATNATN